jgi:hypothetical protein
MIQAKNIKEYAEQVGLDRGYLYELRREMEQASLDTWSKKAIGRPPQPAPDPDIVRLQAKFEESDENAKVWEIRARAAEIILEVVKSAGVLKKTSSARPIFWRS